MDTEQDFSKRKQTLLLNIGEYALIYENQNILIEQSAS